MQLAFKSEFSYVWPDARGEYRGLAIEPLYKEQVKAAALDETLYMMLALLDVIRVGRVREMEVALAKLKNLLQ